MKKSRGAILIITIIVMIVLFAIGAIVLKIAASESRIVKMEYERKKAFYIAEGGLEKAKVLLAKNPDWFTDQPHSPSSDADWIINDANGYEEVLGEGSFKIVRESGKNIIYTVGYINKSRNRSAISVLMMEYQSKPFKQLNWKIL